MKEVEKHNFGAVDVISGNNIGIFRNGTRYMFAHAADSRQWVVKEQPVIDSLIKIVCLSGNPNTPTFARLRRTKHVAASFPVRYSRLMVGLRGLATAATKTKKW